MPAVLLLSLACEWVGSAPGTGSTIQLSGMIGNAGQLTWSGAGAVDGKIYSAKIVDQQNFELFTATYNSASNSLTGRTTIIASVGGVTQTTPINASATAIICSTAHSSDIFTKSMGVPTQHALFGGI